MVWRPLGSRGGLRLLWPLRALPLPALPVLALPVLALLRREGRFPGAAAADRRVGRLRDLLWGGASAMAVPALQALVDAPVGSGVDLAADLAADRGATFRINPFRINPQWARLQAALALAAWWDFHGDTNRALQLLEALGTCPAAIRQRPERIIPLAVLLQRSGQIGAAQQLLAPQVMANNPHAALACANLVADPATRLARINRIYTDRGFMPLVMADPLGVLSLDQLRGTPPQPPDQIPDQIALYSSPYLWSRDYCTRKF